MNHPPEPSAIGFEEIRDAASRFLSVHAASKVRSYVRRETRKSVQAVIRRIVDAGWEAYLVGGTIRDLVLGPRIIGPNALYPRDIDILLVGVPHEIAKELLADLYVRDTRFGGLHLIDRKPEGWGVLFDVWTLDRTWAIEFKGLPPEIRHFPQTPFLNLDTAAVEISAQRGKSRQIFENGFIDGINRRTIELNFEPNPYPDVCLVRSLIMAAKLQFTIGPKLLDFIVRHAAIISIDRLMAAQRSHYGKHRFSAQELSLWIESLIWQAHNGKEGRLSLNEPRQLALWTDYPPLDSKATRETETDPSLTLA